MVQSQRPISVNVTVTFAVKTKKVVLSPVKDLRVAEGVGLVGRDQISVLVLAALGSFRTLTTLV